MKKVIKMIGIDMFMSVQALAHRGIPHDLCSRSRHCVSNSFYKWFRDTSVGMLVLFKAVQFCGDLR